MIAVIDYQMGNLRSVQKGFQRVGHDVLVTSDPEVVRGADKLVLPGVGAFCDAAAELRRRELVEPIREGIAAGRPFLGICLGLQLLFDVSDEGGRYEGFGIVGGRVERFEPAEGRKVPHMGWNQVRKRGDVPILYGIPNNSYFYFVHSHYVVPADGAFVAGETTYGRPFCSMIWRDNLFATQFHPEKSQADGLRILKNFAEL